MALASTRIEVSKRKLLRGAHDAGTANLIFDRAKTGFLVPLREWAGDIVGLEPGKYRGLRGWGRAVHARFR